MTVQEQTILDRMVMVELPTEDSFLVIKETLTRMGVASFVNKTLTQSCNILHKKGLYYITHFKLLFELDGRFSNIDESDISRMNTIAKLLESWGLLKIVNPGKMKSFASVKNIKILSSKEKEDWQLVTKHRIGNVR